MERLSDYNQTEALVSAIVPGSIAEELGIVPGSWVMAIDGQKIVDVFDYRTREKVEELTVLIRDPRGELTEYEIEKDADEDLGLDFENPMLASCRSCTNKCIFCFIDQLPPGLRKSLYFKDDDSRLSFLTGNYVTLTNIPEKELDRIISYRFSPINLSVHTTNPELRVKMMKNPKAADLLPRLHRILDAGLEVNCQLVMCPGWNDGVELDRSLADLTAYRPELVRSIAAVPIGLTKYREGLPHLDSYDQAMAAALIDQIGVWQERFMREQGRHLAYASDEFYALAKRPIPDVDFYEGYSQLENGVGMLALFRDTMQERLRDEVEPQEPTRYALPSKFRKTWLQGPKKRVLIATGTLAEPFLTPWQQALAERFNLDLEIRAIRNNFFGETVTVSGLIVGGDLFRQSHESDFDVLMISENMLKRDDDVFLDDMRLDFLATALARPVLSFGESAEALHDGLAWISRYAESITEVLAC